MHCKRKLFQGTSIGLAARANFWIETLDLEIDLHGNASDHPVDRHTACQGGQPTTVASHLA